MVGIKQLIRPHEGDEVLGVRKIDDIVRPAGDHMDGFDLVAADLKADFLIRVDIALLNQRVTAHDDEKLPLAVVPVLTLGDTGLTDVHTKLSMIGCFQKLGKGAAVIAIHLERELEVLCRQIAQIEAVELLGKAAVGNMRHDQRIMLRLEFL